MDSPSSPRRVFLLETSSVIDDDIVPKKKSAVFIEHFSMKDPDATDATSPRGRVVRNRMSMSRSRKMSQKNTSWFSSTWLQGCMLTCKKVWYPKGEKRAEEPSIIPQESSDCSDSDSEEDPEESTSTREYFMKIIRHVFIDNIPYSMVKDEDFSIEKKYVAGVLSYFIYWGLFAFFFTSTYIDQTENSPYVSTSYNHVNCDKVGLAVTNSYYIDYDGLWEGDTYFAYYASPYRFQFMKFKVDSPSEYETMMIAYNKSINSIGEYAQTQPLAINLIYWISYIRYYYLPDPSNTSYYLLGSDNLQYMEFTGDPSIVFKASYHQALASSYLGVCQFNGLSTSYSQANAVFRISLDKSSVDALTTDPICSNAIRRNVFAKNWGKNDKEYAFEMDVRAFSTAIAINMGVMELSTLGWSHIDPYNITLNGRVITIGEYFDTRYRFMDPIVCFSDISDWDPLINNATNVVMNDLCFVQHGDTVFLPILHHLGVNLEEGIPLECTCNDNILNDPDLLEICNRFDLIPSLLFYKTNTTTTYRSKNSILSLTNKTISDGSISQFTKLLTLREQYTNYINLNNDGYTATASATISYMGYGDSSVLNTQWFTNAFDFCKIDSEYCSMITFAAINHKSQRISPYHYELVGGHCNNSFVVLTSDEWDRALDPPVDIYESYYVCTQDELNAIINAIGLATGNISSFFLLVFVLTAPIIYLYFTCIFRPKRDKEHDYDPKLIQACLDNFGTLLYRYSDKHKHIAELSYDELAKNFATTSDDGLTEGMKTKPQILEERWNKMDRNEIPIIASVVDEMYSFFDTTPPIPTIPMDDLSLSDRHHKKELKPDEKKSLKDHVDDKFAHGCPTFDILGCRSSEQHCVHDPTNECAAAKPETEPDHSTDTLDRAVSRQVRLRRDIRRKKVKRGPPLMAIKHLNKENFQD